LIALHVTRILPHVQIFPNILPLHTHLALSPLSRAYCTDNAAMIAFVGNYKAQQGHSANFTLDIGDK